MAIGDERLHSTQSVAWAILAPSGLSNTLHISTCKLYPLHDLVADFAITLVDV
jgi:hypothetical protein